MIYEWQGEWAQMTPIERHARMTGRKTREPEYDPVADHAVRNRFIAAGWTPPPEPEKPKVHRVRVVMCDDDSKWRVLPILTQCRVVGDVASVIVDLTEGVFDEEWKR